jgi:hypothetical protein
MRPYELERHSLALKYGTDLPRPAKLKFSLPAFSVGACETMLFSPSGEYLLVPTNNGCFLWEVATGKKLHRLKGPSNPTVFSFNFDGSKLLMRNEHAQFVIFSIPDGEAVAKFAAEHHFRVDGAGCLGPGDSTVLQLANGGILLVIDIERGEVVLQRQLEPSGYSGEVYWFPDSKEVIIAQTSIADRNNLSTPCAMWRWACPLDDHEPIRIPGRWIGLHTRQLSGKNVLLLHHQPGARHVDEHVIEVLDLTMFQITKCIPCGGSIIPRQSLSHDGKAWSVATDSGIQMGIEDEVTEIPVLASAAQFHPTRDLVAIPGEQGFVASISEVIVHLPALRMQRDVQELTQRGYSRMTTLPNRAMPPRIIVFAGARGWLIQSERLDGRHYLPLEGGIQIDPVEEQQSKSEGLRRALERSRAGEGALESSTSDERRHFLGATVTPPTRGWNSALAVSFADDAIDLWPLKPTGELAFHHTWYPVAALDPAVGYEGLVDAIERMLSHFKPRKTQAIPKGK